MSSTPDITYRAYQDGDAPGIVDAFNRVFGGVLPGFVPRDLDEWRWQFDANPGGTYIYLAAASDGTIVSQFAAVGFRAILDEQPTTFVHGVDAFTDPRFRTGLSRPGHFIRTARGFVDAFLGAPPRVPLMWGLPGFEALRVGRDFLKKEIVRSLSVLVGEVAGIRAGAAPGVEIEVPDRFPEEMEDLFHRARVGWGAMVVRDATYLNWRFADHPVHTYRIALARRGTTLLGYAVYRSCPFDGHPGGTICDWLVDPAAPAAADALRAFAREAAVADSHDRVFHVLPDTAPEWVRFQHAGWVVMPSTYYVVARSFVRSADVPWLRDNWYYTLGETDLV